jgi:hypothetical protein
MSASPAHSMSATGHADDVFERLARCDRLLTAKELADILPISPKTLYNYVMIVYRGSLFRRLALFAGYFLCGFILHDQAERTGIQGLPGELPEAEDGQVAGAGAQSTDR